MTHDDGGRTIVIVDGYVFPLTLSGEYNNNQKMHGIRIIYFF